ncbi:hypothetical protein [Fusobacterium sp. MFO224]|uniref:hypothetical protein n=1 Tax=Fusobacterium sp. MFO224 TaxID=3378070 RepID=UPI00385369B0
MSYFFRHLTEYFGLFYIPFLIVIISDFFIIFKKDKNKKIFYRTRLVFGTIFVITLTILILFLKLYFSNNLNEVNIIQYGLNELNLGFIIIFIATLLIENLKLNLIWTLLGVTLFICSFFLIGKEIIKIFKYIYMRKKKIKALKLQKALIDQQIAAKEALEKKQLEKYENQQLIMDLTIQEKIDEALKNKTLPIFEKNLETTKVRNEEMEKIDTVIDNTTDDIEGEKL